MKTDTSRFSCYWRWAAAHGTAESLTARLLAAGYGRLPGVAAWLLCWSYGDRPQAMMG